MGVLISVRVSVFQPEYDDLSTASPQWGKVALLPWDEEIFGFPVADFQLGPNPPQTEDLPLFISALEDFSARTNARLVSAHVQGEDMSTIARLERADFSLVEFSLVATFSRLDAELLPPPSQLLTSECFAGRPCIHLPDCRYSLSVRPLPYRSPISARTRECPRM